METESIANQNTPIDHEETPEVIEKEGINEEIPARFSLPRKIEETPPKTGSSPEIQLLAFSPQNLPG
jgi:hypothetical protein